LDLRLKVLEELKKNRELYFSGEELSRRLGVSRTAVWKQVEALRQQGYSIEAVNNRGYRLTGVPDRLLAAEIQEGLATRIMGRQAESYDQISSTNTVAREKAEAGAPEGLVVVAEEQLDGRGRLGRQWLSPAGKGIWLSLVLRPDLRPAQAPRITLAAAVALSLAIQQATGIRAGIKWPNDLYLNGRKVAGILTELKAEADRIHYIVLGAGVNANLKEEDLPGSFLRKATSLLMELGRPVSRLELVKDFLTQLDLIYPLVGSNFETVLKSWKELSITLGREVKVTSPWEQINGLARDLTDEGALIVWDGRTEHIVYAGDVTLRE